MPRLAQLEAQFLRYSKERSDPHINGGAERETDVWHHVPTLAEADGIMFLCPKCFAANSGPIGTHAVVCWFRGKVPDSAEPGPGRWTPQGTGYEDLTFTPGEPPVAISVLLTGGCGWHGFVKNGSAD